MKVKVIALQTFIGLITKDKIYDIIEANGDLYTIIDDGNKPNEYFSRRFILLSDYREQQINSILDDKEN